jgi:hypothetical protein
MTRKRAPGAGRPPRGNFKNKSEAFTTRITAETRRALEASAREHGRSLSQEAEHGLREYLKKPAGSARNRALATIIGSLATNIERDTGENWRTDTFTGTALLDCVEAVLIYLAPEAENNPAIPPAVEKQAAMMPPGFAEQYRTPAGLGFMRAHSLITQIENRPRPGKMHNEMTVPIGIDASLETLAVLATDLDIE